MIFMSEQIKNSKLNLRFWLSALGVTAAVVLLAFVTNQIRDPMPDFASISDVNERKEAFFNYLRPAIDSLNSERQEERERLLAIRDEVASGESPGFFDKRRLRDWSERYDVNYEPDDLASTIDELLLHLDQIPESMVLAQAAMESAWGTSRFAVDGKNFFGQWCYSAGCGLIPSRRESGASHEVRVFNSAEASVRSYFRNINSHAAYEELRDMRSASRRAGRGLSGHRLVEGLESYSQRGQAYIDELKSVISFNDLE
jgi:Bax protein